MQREVSASASRPAGCRRATTRWSRMVSGQSLRRWVPSRSSSTREANRYSLAKSAKMFGRMSPSRSLRPLWLKSSDLWRLAAALAEREGDAILERAAGDDAAQVHADTDQRLGHLGADAREQHSRA